MLSQLQIFWYSCFFGIILGIVYDIFRIIRMFFTCKIWNIFIQDILYFLIAGILSFIFILSVNFGEVRFYILAGEAMGWIVYYLTLGEVMNKISYKISRSIKNIFIKIYEIILRVSTLLVSKIGLKCLKNNTNDEII